MTSKERVIVALSHEEPDRVPITASFTPEFASRLRQHLGLPPQDLNPHGGVVHDLEEALGLDIIQYSVGIANSYYASSEDVYVCEWGITWKQVEYETPFGRGRYTEIARYPLSQDENIASYVPPDPHREELYAPLQEVLKRYGKDYFILGVTVCTIFEGAWYLRGLERLLMDMVTDEEKANAILDIPFYFHLEAAKRLVMMGVDGIWLGDDVGTQRGMLIAPDLWRKYLKPRMAVICSELKRLNPDIFIAYHSDGNIEPIIEDLIEIGIDVLNPVQPKAMDPAALKRRYGTRLSFWGTIDEQETLPFGTPDTVRREVQERIRVMAPGGGFIIAPTHHVQLDTPLENFLAFLEAAKTYGVYPVWV
uniref:Uroporphyrinogen decarboxylase (URO-D) domain-containing protein n=1 Tax=Candidatus Caldatribacterium saccharofermentans TaxID=1454753 RepID=A0A7V4WL84_9BACT